MRVWNIKLGGASLRLPLLIATQKATALLLPVGTFFFFPKVTPVAVRLPALNDAA